MIRKYVDGDIDAVMQIWLNTNIQTHSFNTVKEMIPLAKIYVYEDDCTKQIAGFIGMNDNYIEGIFVRKAVQSKGIGKQLLNHAKEGKSTLRLSVYQKNKKAIQFYLREEFVIQSENTDNNTDEKEFVMVWNR